MSQDSSTLPHRSLALPVELWHIVLSSCSPADLYLLSVSWGFFRTLILADGMKVLEKAAIRAHYPLCIDIFRKYLEDCSHLPECLKPRNGKDSSTFLFVMCGGPCTVCGTWAGGPPDSSHLRVRVCGREECTARIRSKQYSSPYWSYTDFPDEYLLPLEASFWIPYTIDFKAFDVQSAAEVGSGHAPHVERPYSRYLVEDQDQAWREVCDVRGGIESMFVSEGDPWKLVPGDAKELRLAQVYEERSKRHRALERIYVHVCNWRKQTDEAGQSIRDANVAILRGIALQLKTSLATLLEDPLTQRILAAHSRDLAYAYRSTFRHLTDPAKPVPVNAVMQGTAKLRPRKGLKGRKHSTEGLHASGKGDASPSNATKRVNPRRNARKRAMAQRGAPSYKI